ncbi:sel1 repeat family protein (plasmid) [Bartonella sp. HY328]|nr:tetratricopeptide repeat protein [Bartonella sp. HY328]UXN10960.1 sel1 repeat family protein [Bartonella sp. HY328]
MKKHISKLVYIAILSLVTISHSYGQNRLNRDSSFEEFYKAAQQGEVRAQLVVGTMYSVGKGVAQDVELAVRWYCLAASQGYKEAQYSLGVSYYEGYGIKQDKAEAFRWLKLAAEQGLSLAQFHIAMINFDGDGVEKT